MLNLIFMPPTSNKLEEAYWFGPVRLYVRACVCYVCIRSLTVRDMTLKFYMWNKYEN